MKVIRWQNCFLCTCLISILWTCAFKRKVDYSERKRVKINLHDYNIVSKPFWILQLGSGEGCCNKYWPDDEEQYEHISVKLVSSESYPKYSSRSFLLTNTKNGDALTVTQFHYIGWSGALGEVPLVTYGIMEIITRVQAHTDASLSTAAPTLVHCSGGGDRSSVYACLNNCLRQLRREGRVDLFQTARRIRALRQFQLQEFAQYEFCYKALVEFIDNKGLENLWGECEGDWLQEVEPFILADSVVTLEIYFSILWGNITVDCKWWTF